MLTGTILFRGRSSLGLYICWTTPAVLPAGQESETRQWGTTTIIRSVGFQFLLNVRNNSVLFWSISHFNEGYSSDQIWHALLNTAVQQSFTNGLSYVDKAVQEVNDCHDSEITNDAAYINNLHMPSFNPSQMNTFFFSEAVLQNTSS